MKNNKNYKFKMGDTVLYKGDSYIFYSEYEEDDYVTVMSDMGPFQIKKGEFSLLKELKPYRHNFSITIEGYLDSFSGCKDLAKDLAVRDINNLVNKFIDSELVECIAKKMDIQQTLRD